MNEFLVEIVAGVILLTVLTITGCVSYALKVRAQLSRQKSEISQQRQQNEVLSAQILRVEAEAEAGRGKLHGKIDDQKTSIAESVKHMEQEIGTRLEKLTEMISSFQVAQSALASRVEVMDERGTKYLQLQNDKKGGSP